MPLRNVLSTTVHLASIIGLLPLISSAEKPTANFSGPVVSVLDGDTIEVLHDQHAERIRLSGIDSPEK
jgi:endonuclease YncB( thermonuclease family)